MPDGIEDPATAMLAVLVLVALYQVYKAQSMATDIALAAAVSLECAKQLEASKNAAVTSFTQRGRKEGMSQGGVPRYMNKLNPAREAQWDLLGAPSNNQMANAYKGSGGLNLDNKDAMITYLEDLKGNQSMVTTPQGATCGVAAYTNCPQGLAARCKNNKEWTDQATAEALALAATGAFNVPSMDEYQLYDVARFASDGINPSCSNAREIADSQGVPRSQMAEFRQRRQAADKGDLLRLIE